MQPLHNYNTENLYGNYIDLSEESVGLLEADPDLDPVTYSIPPILPSVGIGPIEEDPVGPQIEEETSKSKPSEYRCMFPGCPRGAPNSGFRRRDNLNQHRRNVHEEYLPRLRRFNGRNQDAVRVQRT